MITIQKKQHKKEKYTKKAIRTKYGNVKGMPILRKKTHTILCSRWRGRKKEKKCKIQRRDCENHEPRVQFHLMRKLSM